MAPKTHTGARTGTQLKQVMEALRGMREDKARIDARQREADAIARDRNNGEHDSEEQSGYLGLIVDQARGEVRRKGYQPTVYFNADSAEWHTLVVAWRAGSDGATQAQWENGYRGKRSAAAMRNVKSRVNDKLSVLDVELAPRVPPRIREKSAT